MKLSIITINYNNAEGLRETMESVFAQTFVDFEYIIVDGRSSDSSISILKDEVSKLTSPSGDGVSAFCETKDGDAISRCTENIEKGWRYTSERLKIVSEPDKGIYNAMNKGIRMAQGEYLQFLNSGDVFAAPDVLEKMFAQSLQADILYGDMYKVKDNDEQEVYYPDEQYIDFMWFVDSTIPHGASFIRRDAFDKVGLYNENNKIVSDWEWFMLAICKYNCSLKHIPIVVYKYDFTGVSSIPENYKMIATERQRALQTHFAAFLPVVSRVKRVEEELDVIHHSFLYRVIRKFCRILGKKI